MDVLLYLPTSVNSTEKEIRSPLRSFFFSNLPNFVTEIVQIILCRQHNRHAFFFRNFHLFYITYGFRITSKRPGGIL